MEDFQQRVVTEKQELDAKLKALSTFIQDNPTYKDLPKDEQDRLMRQSLHMASYSAVLGERITAFN